MNKIIQVMLLAILGIAITSCQKQEIVKQPEIKHIQLTDEETQWLALQNDGARTGADVLNAVMQIPNFATKLFSMQITDSIVFADELTKATSGNEPLVIYVVSGVDDGFALVCKDKILPSVIGRFDGSFDKGNLNPNFEFMLDCTMEQLSCLRDSLREQAQKPIESSILSELQFTGATKRGIDEAPTIPVPWTHCSDFIVDEEWHETKNVLGDEQEFLLSTKWGQGKPFNSWRADGYPVGCVATSAAQIMAYYRKPLTSPVDGQPYDWTSMHNDINGAGKDDVGRLMRDLGLKSNLDIDYGAGGSGAICWHTARTFENFGYVGSSHCDYSYSPIVKTIANRRPVHICGDNGKLGTNYEGHAWVLDGCMEVRWMCIQRVDFYYNADLVYQLFLEPSIKQGYYLFHHNFGWYGDNDGWFAGPSEFPDISTQNNVEIITEIEPRN